MKLGFFVEVIYKLFVATTAAFLLSACSGGGKGEESPVSPVVPALPNIIFTSPTISPLISNQNSITVSGQCIDGATVAVDGDAIASTTCSGGSFTIVITTTTEGTFTYNFKEFTSSADVSTPTILQWTRDVTPPNSPPSISVTASGNARANDSTAATQSVRRGKSVPTV